MPAPLIAVTATVRLAPPGGPRVQVNAAYLRAVEQAGAVPIVIAPLDDLVQAASVLDAVAGLLLTGGEDVAPATYNGPPHATITATTPARDALEIALVEAARDRALPTLAVCRGLQLLNVALGGTLIQDIPTQWRGASDHDPPGVARDARVHELSVASGSRLARALGTTRVATNSFHHQAIDRVASGLTITARAADGVVEAAESVDARWWAVGVQWHPEELLTTSEPWDRALFAGFTTAVQARRRAPPR